MTVSIPVNILWRALNSDQDLHIHLSHSVSTMYNKRALNSDQNYVFIYCTLQERYQISFLLNETCYTFDD